MRLAVLDLTTHPEPLLSGLPRVGEQIINWLSPALPEASFIAISVAQDNDPLPDVASFEGLIVSGSEFGVYDPLDWMAPLRQLLLEAKAAEKPIYGICFGHQLIAKALGGRVEKSPKGWGIGLAFSDVVTTQSWMTMAKDKINLIVSHQDQISELPPNAEVLMSNSFCPYSMIKVGNNFLGLQGHPEFSREYSFALMDSRRDRIGADVIDAGSATLTHDVDDVMVMQWIVNFLKQVS